VLAGYTATAESRELVQQVPGAQCACPPAAAAADGATSSELGSTSSAGDLISEDWFLRFSEYRLEDYYAVQARLDNDAGRPFPVVPPAASTPPPDLRPPHLQHSDFGQ